MFGARLNEWINSPGPLERCGTTLVALLLSIISNRMRILVTSDGSELLFWIPLHNRVGLWAHLCSQYADGADGSEGKVHCVDRPPSGYIRQMIRSCKQGSRRAKTVVCCKLWRSSSRCRHSTQTEDDDLALYLHLQTCVDTERNKELRPSALPQPATAGLEFVWNPVLLDGARRLGNAVQPPADGGIHFVRLFEVNPMRPFERL